MSVPPPPAPINQRRLEEAKILIHQIERRELDAATLIRPDINRLSLSPKIFHRITRLARFWEDVEGRQVLAYERLAEDMLSGLYHQNHRVLYRIWSSGSEIRVGLAGLTVEESKDIEALLYGLYPGIELRVDAEPPSSSVWTHIGLLSGIPARKSGRQQQIGAEDRGDIRQIERLLRGLQNEVWSLLVIADPLNREQPGQITPPRGALVTNKNRLYYPRDYYLERISELAAAARRRYDSFEPIAGDPLELVDRTAQRNVELLELELQRAEIAKTEGLWDVQVCYGAPDPATFGRLQALLRSCFAGDERATQPFRTHTCHAAGKQSPDDARTPLTSRELARYITLPQEEFLGYQVMAYSRFSVTSPSADSSQPMLRIGAILDGVRPLGHDYQINLNDLTKHALIAGTTGSGKTNTCLYLLSQLAQQRVPFLVIEPVNAALNEYRALAHLGACNQSDYNLRIFTLGDDSIAPFALNPLEIEPGTTVDAHISRLLTCFKAAIPMWPPLPAVFLSALQRTYIKAGLLPGIATLPGQRFPTMHDFAAELAYVAEHEVRHGGEARQTIIGASTLRIQALLKGAAGRIITARESIPIEDLLNHPTILELRHIGDDSDKALIIALLIMRIVAAQELASRNRRSDRPAHVMLIEEAHRLLANIPGGSSEQQENTRGEAAQAFAQLLAEARKYGQGIIIAEQLPEKLVRDAIGNTGLKVVHLLTAKEDRDSLAAAMRLDERQAAALASLPTGQAVVYAQGQEAPIRIAVPAMTEVVFTQHTRAGSSHEFPVLTDLEVKSRMERITLDYQRYRLPFQACDACRAQCVHRSLGEAVSRLHEACREVEDAFSAEDQDPPNLLASLLNTVAAYVPRQMQNQLAIEARYCVAIHLLYKTQGALVDTLPLWPAIRSHLQ